MADTRGAVVIYAMAFGLIALLLASLLILRYLEPIYLNTLRVKETTNSMYWEHIRRNNDKS